MAQSPRQNIYICSKGICLTRLAQGLVSEEMTGLCTLLHYVHFLLCNPLVHNVAKLSETLQMNKGRPTPHPLQDTRRQQVLNFAVQGSSLLLLRKEMAMPILLYPLKRKHVGLTNHRSSAAAKKRCPCSPLHGFWLSNSHVPCRLVTAARHVFKLELPSHLIAYLT